MKIDHLMFRESLEDVDLENICEMLERLHQKFYQAEENKLEEQNIIQIFENERKNLFDGFTFAFSSLFPTSEIPQKTVFFRLAQLFGAKCVMEVTSEVTHLISQNKDTDKSHIALHLKSEGHKIHLVNPFWFYDSILHWKRMSEQNFPLQDSFFLQNRHYFFLNEMMQFYESIEADSPSSTPNSSPPSSPSLSKKIKIDHSPSIQNSHSFHPSSPFDQKKSEEEEEEGSKDDGEENMGEFAIELENFFDD